MHDLIITGGTVADGTGAPARTADVAVDDGIVTEIGPLDGARARRRIDASGLLVTPGWVDIHCHYDGQATWDDVLAPSSWHGVTTVVMGNCGVGFAPAKPDRHDWLIGLMEGVEDIPGTALAEGIRWEWESFPEYLDALSTRSWTVDVGTQVPHGAVRAYVMGDRGARNEPATPDEIEAMRAIVRDALAAGALGFSTSRTIAHTAIDGEPVPGTFAAEDELFGIGAALADLGTGVFELAPAGAAGEDVIAPAKEVAWMRRLSAAIGRPVTFALIQVDDAPGLWRELMDQSLDAVADGADLWPQVAGRPTGLLSGHFTTYSLFDMVPAYQELKSRGLDDAALVAALRDPATRRSIVSWRPPDADTAERMARAYGRTYVLGLPPDYEPGPERSLAAVASASGRSPLEVAYDAMLEDQGRALLYVPILNYADGDLEPVRQMLLHPRAALGLADGGAHCGVICDASMPTFMLTHWTRDRQRGDRLPLEWVVKKQTYDTARLYGLGDRGTIEPGMLADVNVIDYDRLQLGNPRVAADLPAGGHRLLQSADGYAATVKRGVVTFEEGEDTGERPAAGARRPVSGDGSTRELGADGAVTAGAEARRPVTIPVARYLDPEFAAREAALLWPRVWQFACSAQHVAQPGDFYEHRVGPLSILVVRDGDGVLRAFQNVCRHRGSVICEGSGVGLEHLRCPFHRWTWDLQGRLREVPSRRAFGVRNDELPLIPASVDTWGPMVFVNADANAEPLHTFLEPVPEDARWARVDEFACTASASVPARCNWKTLIDAFSETYHVQGIHREMLAMCDDVRGPQGVWERHGKLTQPYGLGSPRLGEVPEDQEVWEAFVQIMGNRVGLPTERDAAGPAPEAPPGGTFREALAQRVRENYATRGVDLSSFDTDQTLNMSQYNLFPNLTVLVFSDMLHVIRSRPGSHHEEAWMDAFLFERMPTGPDAPTPSRPLDVVLSADDDLPLGLVLGQDVANFERAHRGMHQPGLTHLVVSPTEECRLVNLHRNLERVLGIAPSELTGAEQLAPPPG